MLRLAPVAVGLLLLASCTTDPGFPWPDELSAGGTETAAFAGTEVVGQIEQAVADSNPWKSNTFGCTTYAGTLTSGGDPVDSDGDGIPDHLILKWTTPHCGGSAYSILGSLTISDPGATPGYDYSADYIDSVSPGHLALHVVQVRHVRYNGATTTGSVSGRFRTTSQDYANHPFEEEGYSATFTLVPNGAATLAPGLFGPATLSVTGVFDNQDAIPPTGPTFRFNLSSGPTLTLDPACTYVDGITGGEIDGMLNGSGPAKFTRAWSDCDVDSISVEGTTD